MAKIFPLPDRSDQYEGGERRLAGPRRVDGYGRRKADFDRVAFNFDTEPGLTNKKGRVGGRRDATPTRTVTVDRNITQLGDQMRLAKFDRGPVVLIRRDFASKGTIDKFNIHIEQLTDPIWVAISSNTSPTENYFKMQEGDNSIPRIAIDFRERFAAILRIQNSDGSEVSPGTTEATNIWWSAEFIPG